ncbi:magnesium transporter CorA family protein [Rhodobacter sp. CZR27]|uniref:magnesium transporter CorA family protein n=1 Tax=Rhodobacter sp. CZR27 TaxID=2033869 RepID=UPI000BBEA402|nr:magnesium transporter CorA family protein [Rhodobacter sp. CZR27]
MLFAYQRDGAKLQRLPPPTGPDPDAWLGTAIWIDLYKPLPTQTAAVQRLGIEVPSLADMEEIEVSSRLYREDGIDYMTVVLPGQTEMEEQISAPVCFVLTRKRLVTVRHHAPRPFETYPERADKVGTGCATPEQIFLGLIEEIVGRLADLLEASGRSLDTVARAIFQPSDRPRGTPPAAQLQGFLEQIGREGERIGHIRLALLTLERALGFFAQTLPDRVEREGLKPVVKTLQRDMTAMEVHADFLSQRVALATDATLGMINLAQNATVRIVSVVAVLFLPPTLVASIYGMNFARMPELAQPWGYPLALALMLASAGGAWAFFRWKNWL